jgi:RNA-directed DNA polymerase
MNSKIREALWLWAKRRHPNKGKRWIMGKYFTESPGNKWVFYAHRKGRNTGEEDKVTYTSLPARVEDLT